MASPHDEVAAKRVASDAPVPRAAQRSKWSENAPPELQPRLQSRSMSVGRKPSSHARQVFGGKDFWAGASTAALIWCVLLLGLISYKDSTHADGGAHRTADSLATAFLRSDAAASPCPLACHCGANASGSVGAAPSSVTEVSASSSDSAHPSPQPSLGSAPLASSRSEYTQRFTDMTCFTHGDESELCRYEHALCYDGERLVFSVPEPPGPRVGSNDFGHVMRELTANCYDYRYYDVGAAEVGWWNSALVHTMPVQPLPARMQYTGCRYDSPRFHRLRSSVVTPQQLSAQPLFLNASSTAWGNSFAPDELLEPLFASRDIKSDWAIPLTRRRWGPANRGQLLLREIRGSELFGAVHPENLTESLCNECIPPPPPEFPPEMRVSHVTQFGNTTATWLDGALWIMTVDAQFAEHIYHFSTRILSLFTAQRHNRSQFGENPADGYLLPWTKRSHPIEITWHHKVPFRRNPAHRDISSSPDHPVSPRDEINQEGFIEEADAPNRVQYLSGNQFPDLPPIDYVAFVGPSAIFPGVRKMLPFLQAMLQLSGQPHTQYFARDETSKLSPNNLICSKRGAVVGSHNALFPSRADAWLFRQTAYDFAGLTRQRVTSHDAYPPSKITLITRKRKNGRNFENEGDMIAAARATGLEVEVIEDLGKMPFKKVVAAMAGTGILIAAHGAALVNAMFLPQHAVVVEIFPYYMKKMTYSSLSSVLGHFYFPMYSWTMPQRTPENNSSYAWRLAAKEDFPDRCLARNLSTIDALLDHACNSVSKALPIDVDIEAFKEVLHNSLDVISVGSPAKLKLETGEMRIEALADAKRSEALAARRQKQRNCSDGSIGCIKPAVD